MNLWRRGARFTFQQRIPHRLIPKFGTTPFRTNLGLLSNNEASRRAKILAGAVLTWMDTDMPRGAISRSLHALNKSMDEVDAEVKDSTSFKRWHLTVLHGLITSVKGKGGEYDQQMLDHIETALALYDARENSARYTREKLDAVKIAAEADVAAWQTERATLHDVIGTIAARSSPVENELPPTAEGDADHRAVTSKTTFGVAGRFVLDARKAALDPSDQDASRYEERLETSFAAFLEVVGDKPLSYYLPIHMQDFATVLARVPANRSKYPSFKGLTLKQMGDKNAKLPPDQRKKCLSETTVASYLSEVNNIWTRVAAGVPGLRDMAAYRVTMPKDTEEAIERNPLTVNSVDIWLRDAATPKLMRKPHKAWLPLVGLLTGMRLAELVYLQKTDIVDIEGNEVFDLRRPLIIGGQEIDRPLKTKTSKRIVAIHPLLGECGFVDYVKNVRSPNGFVFGHFQKTDDPSDAAGKQLGNWMRVLGIHETQRQVFHSLRHNAKDWLRDNVGERLSDKQCDHALNGVSANYGAKLLKPTEVCKIMAIPAPEEVDFSTFIEKIG